MTEQALTPFSEHIRTMNKGEINDELTQALAELVSEVRVHGREGTLDLSIVVKPDGDAQEWVRLFVKKIATKLPQPNRKGMTFYSTYDGDLLRDDPDQQKLDLKQVGQQQNKEPFVDKSTGEIL